MLSNCEFREVICPDDSLVPVFLATDLPKRFGQMGSAIFLEFHGNPFLLTAAHVTDVVP